MNLSRSSRAAGLIGPGLLGTRLLLSAAGTIPVLLTTTAAQGAAITAPGGCRLSIDIPKGFSAQARGADIVLHPIGQEGRRSVFEIRLTPGHSRDATALTEHRPLGPTIARYRMTRETEGSGGEETTLIAEVQRVGGVIRLEASAQRDDGAEPDFEPAWSALATARCTEIR
ncbi:Tsi3 family protein [Methylorubrum extorquens]|uniref:Tsi3 family protein n=1 Tax=Methylorubrum extorquens TaxID=408 RepID=UPI001EE63476|nr:Tsi3 family protein [Methylorubrum extorquens]MCG5246820.1 Tsi3 family protein [Methylorubrum extorquens]